MGCQILLTSISLLSNLPRGNRNSSRSHGLHHDSMNDCKRIWKGVNPIVNYKPPTSANHIKLRVNDRDIVSPVEVANAFNTYFSGIGNDLTKSISIKEKSPVGYLRNPVYDSLLFTQQLQMRLKMRFLN